MAVEQEQVEASQPNSAQVIVLHPKPIEVTTKASLRLPRDWREAMAIVVVCVVVIVVSLTVR